MSRFHGAFWWSLFSAGGVMAALFVPAIILSTGFLLPTDNAADAAVRYAQFHGTVGWWPVRLVLFAVIFLTFFHCAHRLRHTLMDLGLRRLSSLLAPVCYSAALAGAIVAAIILARV